MKYDYIFYVTDESFDYGDFPGSSYYEKNNHGFSIDIDSNNVIDIASLTPFGDFYSEMKNIKTLEELKQYLEIKLKEVKEWEIEESQFTNLEIFEELIKFLQQQILIERKAA